jgi:hypothetical protein
LLAGSGRKPKIPINTRGTQFASTNWTFFKILLGNICIKKAMDDIWPSFLQVAMI